MRLIQAILVAAMVLWPAAALAGDPPRRLAHYTHQRWTEASDAPAPVLAMAQGRDGFLWLATGQGLFRFDGIGFERITATQSRGKDDPPSALLVARNGDVWTNFEASRRFAIYRAGALRVLDMPAAPDRIIALAEGSDGTIWALTAKFEAEVLHLRNGRWQLFDAAQGLPRDDALGMLVADDGAVWLSFTNSVARLPLGATRFEIVRETPRANGRLSQDPDGRVWLSEKGGSYPISGPKGRGPPPRLAAPYRTDDAQIRGAPMFDRAGNLWVATRYAGVQRVTAASPPGPARGADTPARIESLRSRDGLSSDVTNQVLEDREGNIWVGSEEGLDKLRPATLRSEPELTAPAAFGDKLMEASDGSVYIGQSKTIYRVAPGGDPEPILRNVLEPQSICEAPDGAIWIAFATRVIVWRGGHVRETFARPDTDTTVYDCAFDARGDYWLSAAAGGLLRYRRGQWDAISGPAHGQDFNPTTMVRDAWGRLVVQWTDRSLAWITPGGRTITPLDFGTGHPAVLTLYATPGGDVFAAGAFGLSRFRAGKIQTVWADQASPGGRINGIVQTPDGDTWLAYPRALVRLRSQELERAFSHHAFFPPALALGFGDGLTSRPHSHTQRALVRGGDGRLWIATETGTLWMDPARIAQNPVPPGVAIKSLTGDGQFYRDPAALRLRASTSNIEIDFAVLNFAAPKDVSVRYRLEGFDRAWIDPGARRQAFYTNLRPGKYRFHVIAAARDGVWNRTGAAVDFEIPPTFLQSRGFLVLCLVLVTALLWLLYRVRMARVSQRVRVGLEARLGERERIARELHDTLLQSVQGLILRFQSVANRMAPGDPSRDQLEAALKRADDVIVDGRNRVRDLRTAESPGDLRAVLQDVVNATAFEPPIPVRIIVEGAPRAVHPLVSAEIGRIAGEALFNIVRHARASSVDAVIRFDGHQLCVQIRDDGVGIAKDVLEAGGLPGHFGLVGMRERAQRIGGAFSVASRPGGAGTEITLKLPARLAFADRAPGKWRLASLLRPRKGAAGV